jgi:hypothetical protein
MPQVVISKTGVAHGWGSDPYKWVSHLTQQEKAHVRAGGIVLVTDCPPCGGGSKRGCTSRRVIYAYGRFTHRCSCGITAS